MTSQKSAPILWWVLGCLGKKNGQSGNHNGGSQIGHLRYLRLICIRSAPNGPLFGLFTLHPIPNNRKFVQASNLKTTMKPQSLQDAIKAAAAKKKSKAWKEPPVKKHQMTAEEFLQEKQSRRGGGGIVAPQSPASVVTPMGGGGGMSASAGQEILRKIEREREAFQKEKQSILNEMALHKKEMTSNKSEMSQMKKEVEGLKKLVHDLHAENKALRENMVIKTKQTNDEWPHLKPYTADKMQKFQSKLFTCLA